MAVNCTKYPLILIAAGNPVWYKFQSSAIASPAGTFATNIMVFSGTATEGNTVTLAWNNLSLTFTFTAAYDAYTAGLYLPLTHPAGLQQYVALVAEYLLKNYYIERDFVLTQNNLTLTLTAKNKGICGNITFTEGLGYLTCTNGSAVDEVPYPFYKLINRIYAQWGSGDDVQIGEEDGLDFDENKEAINDISEYLSNYLELLQETHESFKFPEIGEDLIITRAHLIINFFIKYTELYGNPPTPKILKETEKCLAIGGGLNFENQAFLNLHNINFWAQLQATSKFLTNKPLTWVTDYDAIEKLYWLNKPGVTYVKLMIEEFGGLLGQTVVKTEREVEKNNVYEIIISPKKVLSPGQKYFLVWLQDGSNNIITEKRKYIIDETYYENKRQYFFKNSSNLMDTCRAFGQMQKEVDIANETFIRPLPIDFTHLNRPFNQKRGTEKQYYKINFGYADTREISQVEYMNFYRDFLLSPQRFEIVGENLKPINLSAARFKLHDTNEFLFALECEITCAFEDNYYSVNQLATSGAVFEDSFDDGFNNTDPPNLP